MFVTSIWIVAVGLFMGSVITSYVLYKMAQKQQLAYFGDKDAARHLILPCYKPLFRSVSAIFIFLVLASLVSSSAVDKKRMVYLIVEFCCMTCTVVFSIPLVLLLQPSVSKAGFWRTTFILFPWWLLLCLVWTLSSALDQEYRLWLKVILNISTVLPPLVLCLGMLSGLIASRMQLGSRSNRSCVEFLFCYSVCYGGLMIISTGFNMHSPAMLGLSVILFLGCQLFPVALYRTLLADTKFWRGMGKHNTGGITAAPNTPGVIGAIHQALPELTMRVASNDFQIMLGEVRELFIDFAFIQIGPIIGTGSSADVYRGSLRQIDVAVKVSTPPEITAEELLKIRQEAVINSKLQHPCIVRFYGICIRPPQIGIVIEFCDHGNLKDSLEKDIAEWTPLRRIEAAYDACRAVAFVHSEGLMHRDIKAENFFVTHKWKVKLGDFGESTTIKTREEVAASGNRMTVLGTVAYMAPELVEGKKFYSEGIDTHALAITVWQIWTGRLPYDGVDTFSLYDMITSGRRPPLPVGAPEGLAEVISEGWTPDVKQRVTAQSMADKLAVIVENYKSSIEHNKKAISAHTPSLVRKDTVESNESLQILGTSNFMDDDVESNSGFENNGMALVSPCSSFGGESQMITPVQSPLRPHKSFRSPKNKDYNSLEDEVEDIMQGNDGNMTLDLSCYTDDELYQGYGRKSAIDVKRSNPLIPTLRRVLSGAGNSSPSPSPSKGKKIFWNKAGKK